MERGAMPHFKCVPCRARILTAHAPPDLMIDLCPSCGAPLEPVAALAEIVGFRSIRPYDEAEMSNESARLADRVRDFRSAYTDLAEFEPPPTAHAIAMRASENDR